MKTKTEYTPTHTNSQTNKKVNTNQTHSDVQTVIITQANKGSIQE